MEPLRSLRLNKEKNRQKQQIEQKKLREKSVEAIKKNELFIENFFIFKNFLTTIEFFFITNWLKETNKYEQNIKTTKLLRKTIVSRPSNSIAFNGNQLIKNIY